jgi:hypothetical protein
LGTAFGSIASADLARWPKRVFGPPVRGVDRTAQECAVSTRKSHEALVSAASAYEIAKGGATCTRCYKKSS